MADRISDSSPAETLHTAQLLRGHRNPIYFTATELRFRVHRRPPLRASFRQGHARRSGISEEHPSSPSEIETIWARNLHVRISRVRGHIAKTRKSVLPPAPACKFQRRLKLSCRRPNHALRVAEKVCGRLAAEDSRRHRRLHALQAAQGAKQNRFRRRKSERPKLCLSAKAPAATRTCKACRSSGARENC